MIDKLENMFDSLTDWCLSIMDLRDVKYRITLLLQIGRSKSCAGISGKSQILYLVVFGTRYLDLFTLFVSVYNTVMKVLPIDICESVFYLL